MAQVVSGALNYQHGYSALFSVFMTLKMWKINPRTWLADYLNACAVNNQKSPENLSLWLPWWMSENRLSEMQNHDPPRRYQVINKKQLHSALPPVSRGSA